MMRSPLTGGDLRDLADSLDELEATQLAGSKVIRSMLVALSDDEDTIGQFVRFDESDPGMGWGFVPDEVEL